jgi:hypothetical protein
VIAVEIAGLVCHIESPDAVFAARLASRWAGFGSGARPDVTLRVEVVPPPAPATLRAWTGPFARFGHRAHELLIEGPGFHGRWDARTGHGRIAQPAEPAALETLLTAILATRLLSRRGCLLHAAALVGPDGVRVFFGPSGSGKTTVATLVAEGVITDEITAIRRVPGGWRVSGVPWRGTRLEADLDGIFRLRKGPGTSFRPLAPGEAARELLGSAFLPRADGAEIERFLGVAGDLVESVPCWEMTFAPERAFWDVVPRLGLEVAR